jgi:hypothetical protein
MAFLSCGNFRSVLRKRPLENEFSTYLQRFLLENPPGMFVALRTTRGRTAMEA